MMTGRLLLGIADKPAQLPCWFRASTVLLEFSNACLHKVVIRLLGMSWHRQASK